jgi:hypothetical protein
MEIVSSAMMLVNLVVHVPIAIIAVFTMFVMFVVLARLLWRNIYCVAGSYNYRSCYNNCTHLWMSLVCWRLNNSPYSTCVNSNVNVTLGVCCSYAYHAY